MRSAGTASGSREPGGACPSACSPPERTRSRAPSCAWRPTGTQSSSSGTTEVGQGARTVFAQIAAEELRLPAERVTVRGADTRYTPYDRSTGASRSTTVAGLAVKRAAEEVRAQLVAIAGSDDVESDSYPELFVRHFGLAGGELIGRGEVAPEGSGSYAEGPVFWEVCVGAAEVAVDEETGRVRVLKTATVADVGRAINPQLVERQDEGGTLQGLGNALYEELVFEDGLLLNETLLDYRVPGFEDVPDEMHCIIVENEDGPGPYGAKGCGEGALAAVTAAVATAVADAGVPVTELPLTPERVWRGIQELKKEGHGRGTTRSSDRDGDDGPRHGRGARPRGHRDGALRRLEEALERAKGGVTMAEGVLDRLDAAQETAGRSASRPTWPPRSKARTSCSRPCRRRSSSSTRCSRSSKSTWRMTPCSPRTRRASRSRRSPPSAPIPSASSACTGRTRRI